ncbi:MAG: UDP-2,3-diacylglucosamine diphosphatase LpxI [Phreatobacter sp.]|nr:UDP-2,3-diacylglucosamine diphosphatase LpxI [Phreatobacter sp.]
MEKAAAAGLRGIAVVAGSTLVVDMQEVIRTADRLGLFVVGVEGQAAA